MFSDDCNLTKPDISLLAEEIAIKPQDRVLASEVPFRYMTVYNRYPNPKVILAQLPQNLNSNRF